MKHLIRLVAMGALLSGCEHQYLADDGHFRETPVVDATENKQTHFLPCGADFSISASLRSQIEKILKDARGQDITNIGFMLVSKQSIPLETQEKVRNTLKQLMRENGFISSRIVDSGIAVYDDARTGIRIDVLSYHVTDPDVGTWTEYDGDCDSNKQLPKYGTSDVYNLGLMIANKADLISPRKYKGQEVDGAIAALSSSGSSSSGSSSSSSSSSSGDSSSSESSSSGTVDSTHGM